MRNLKKFLALVLAFMMTMSLMVTANAANVTFTDSEDVTAEFQDDITILAGIGVIKGQGNTENGQLTPQRTITRAEMAAIVYRLHTGDVNDTRTDLYKGSADFNDVPETEWFAGYIGYCNSAQIIVGDGNGYFRPNEPVTGYEALTMLLRAMGYDQNQEFSSSAISWQVQVAQIATNRDLLVNTDKTTYSGKLSEQATRELVFELAFQAATKPTVQYTAAFGYQIYALNGIMLSGILNPSLAETFFGLTSATGIVVGNQATGENATKISYAIKGNFYTNSEGNTAVDDFSYVGSSYEYLTSNKTNSNNLTRSDPNGQVTVSYDYETGLDMFGHEATIWYDARSDEGVETVESATNAWNVPSEFSTVYAVLDRATHTAVVYAGDGASSPDTSATISDTTTTTQLGYAAKNAGFTVGSGAVMSDAFGAIVTTPAQTGSFSTGGTKGIYALISNSNDKTLDVVVALNVDVDYIDKVNNYSSNKTVTHTHNTDEIFRSAPSAKNKDLLVYGEDDIAVGQYVVLNKIYGTGTEGITALGSQYFYGINLLSWSGYVTIKAIDSNGKVTLSDGSTIERSPLWYAAHGAANESILGASNLLIGNTVAFLKDGDGKYVGCFVGGDEELLGAYAYWQQNAGDIDKITYYLQGVTKDGNIVTKEITERDYFGTFASQAAGYIPIHHMRNTIPTDASYGSNLQIVKPDTGTGYKDYKVSAEGTVSSAGWASFTGESWNENSRELISGKFFSDDTVFHVVTGYGSTLHVDHYTGLTALLQGAPSVQADGWYFKTEDDTEHSTSQNDIVGTVILVNTKWIQPSAFLYNKTAYTLASTDPMTAKKDAVQLELRVAGEKDAGALLVSKIGSSSTITSSVVDTSLTLAANTFYTYTLTDKGYYELTADPMNGTKYGVRQVLLDNQGTSFGYIKQDSSDDVWYALNATVIDISGGNSITDYETLRRAAEENNVTVDILLTSSGGSTASVIYVTDVATKAP